MELELNAGGLIMLVFLTFIPFIFVNYHMLHPKTLKYVKLSPVRFTIFLLMLVLAFGLFFLMVSRMLNSAVELGRLSSYSTRACMGDTSMVFYVVGLFALCISSACAFSACKNIDTPKKVGKFLAPGIVTLLISLILLLLSEMSMTWGMYVS